MPPTPATEWYEKMVEQGTMPLGMACWEADEYGQYTIHSIERWCCAKNIPPLEQTDEEVESWSPLCGMKFGAAGALRAHCIKKHDRPGYTVSAGRQGAYSDAKKAAAEEYFAAMFQRHKEAKEAKGEGSKNKGSSSKKKTPKKQPEKPASEEEEEEEDKEEKEETPLPTPPRKSAPYASKGSGKKENTKPNARKKKSGAKSPEVVSDDEPSPPPKKKTKGAKKSEEYVTISSDNESSDLPDDDDDRLKTKPDSELCAFPILKGGRPNWTVATKILDARQVSMPCGGCRPKKRCTFSTACHNFGQIFSFDRATKMMKYAYYNQPAWEAAAANRKPFLEGTVTGK
ncbi:uncharacterized protein SEPMUDRAFT_152478 [Sphaerulina musiva SO2202]|uniref:Uncharacterized protein n=1 Tax=Sphaerulina musiva (strain SO2202) TaxID=692275 RepID=M3CUU5_SPHMS|nr:uncharacterized protein SEPMUDRAFT_152478 [Sphaerulina musiva SO2202]EMF07917.1 hypothetical protein SEPMUDRAFT_152478 [Sphaerulina musiva SO2202]